LARKTLNPIKEIVEKQDRFISDASHELRIPLAAMKGEIEVALRDKRLSLKEAKLLLKSNLEEVNKLKDLSHMLLTLASYDQTKEINFNPISLKEVITDAYRKVEKKAREKKIKIIRNIQDVKIKGDYQSLVELILIILDNAIKYSHPRSKIYLSLEQVKNQAVVKIKDEGIGIKDSQLPYIFDRFYRGDTSRSKIKTTGYGLGLSIAKRIVDLHHGFIKVKSEFGKGSTFTIILRI